MLKDKKECSLPEEIPCYLLNQGISAVPSARDFVQIVVICLSMVLSHFTVPRPEMVCKKPLRN